MKHLVTTDNGGFPLKANDVRWLADGIIEAINNLMGGVNSTASHAYIIYGCIVTDAGSDWDVSEGWVVFNKELRYLAATTFAKGSGATFRIVASSEYDAAGLKTFLDSSTHDTYLNQIAIVTDAVPGGGVPSITICTSTAITSLSQVPYWHTLVGKGDWFEIPSSDYQGNYVQATIKFQIKKRGNMLEFRGKIAHTTPSLSVGADEYMLLLPVNCRPQASVFVPVEGAAGGIGWVEIKSNGEVHVRGDMDNSVGFTTTDGPNITGTFALT